MTVYIFCIFLLSTIFTYFDNWNLDLTCDTFYIQWFVNFCNLYLDQMDSELNINVNLVVLDTVMTKSKLIVLNTDYLVIQPAAYSL
jgi:hypothetical protein